MAKKISYVNQWVNNSAKQGTDYSIWGQEDYWATPYETIAKGAADCEDYAMTKYFLLVDLGIPKERLYLSHVSYIDQEAPHMVLIYQSIEDNGFYVLDNIVEKITASNLRTDLTYKYSFNEIGIWIGRPINFIRNEKKHTTPIVKVARYAKQMEVRKLRTRW